MEEHEFTANTKRLGDIVLAHVVNQFRSLGADAVQWNLAKIFGIYTPMRAIQEELDKPTKTICAVCWSEHWNEDGVQHDYSKKEEMARLLLDLEEMINAQRSSR